MLNVMSALTPKADVCGATRDVRFGQKADIGTASDSGKFWVQTSIPVGLY
jgi:hypothetical protein